MTNAELAVLSLIAEAPRHGYEIEQVIEARGMREWTEVGFSSIYYLLAKLEKKGYIRSRSGGTVGKGAPRKVYTITTRGEARFREAVLEALSTPARDATCFQLGLANITHVPKHLALEALGEHVEALRSQRAHIRNRWEEQAPLPPHVDGMFDLSLKMIDMQLDWIRKFKASWEQEDGKS